MSGNNTFDEVLEAIEHLSADQQSDLIEVVRRRLAERGRKQVVADVGDGRAEFASGGATPSTPEDLLKEINS